MAPSHAFEGDWNSDGVKLTVKGVRATLPSGKFLKFEVSDAKTCFLTIDGEQVMGKLQIDRKTLKWGDGDIWYRWKDVQDYSNFTFEGDWNFHGERYIIHREAVKFPSGKEFQFYDQDNGRCFIIIDGVELEGALANDGRQIQWDDGDVWKRGQPIGTRFMGDWVSGGKKIAIKRSLVEFESGTTWEDIRGTNAKTIAVVLDDEEFTGKLVDQDNKIIWSDGDRWYRAFPLGHFEGEWVKRGIKVQIIGSTVRFPDGSTWEFHPMSENRCVAVAVAEDKEITGELTGVFSRISWSEGNDWYKSTRVADSFQGDWMKGDTRVTVCGCLVQFPSGPNWFIRNTSATECLMVADNDELIEGSLVVGKKKSDKQIHWSDGSTWQRAGKIVEGPKPVGPRFEGTWKSGNARAEIQGRSLIWDSGKTVDIIGLGDLKCALVLGNRERKGELVHGDQQIRWDDGDRWYREGAENEYVRREFVGYRFEGKWMSGDMQVRIDGSMVYFPSGVTLNIDGTGDSTCILVIGNEEHTGELVDGDQTILWSDGDKWQRVLMDDSRRELVSFRFEGDWKSGDMRVQIEGSSVYFPSGKVLDIDGTGETTCILVIGEDEHTGELIDGDQTIIWSDGDRWHRVLTTAESDRRELVGPRFEGEWKSSDMQVKIEGSSVFFSSGKVLDIDGAGDTTCILVIGDEEHMGELVDGDRTINWSDGDKWHRMLNEVETDRQDLVGPRFEGKWRSGAMTVKIEGSSVFFPYGAVLDLDRIGDTTCILTLDDEEHTGQLTENDQTIVWTGGDQWYRVLSDEESSESRGLQPVEASFEGRWMSGDVQISIRGTEVVFPTGMVLQIEGTGETTVVLDIGGEDQEGQLENNGQEIVWTGGDIWHRVADEERERHMKDTPTSESCRQELVNPRFEGMWSNGEMEVTISGSVVIFPSGATFDIDGTGENTCILVIGDEEHTGDLVQDDQTIVWSDGDVWQRMKEAETQEGAKFQGEWFLGETRILIQGSTASLPSGKTLQFEASDDTCAVRGSTGDEEGYSGTGKLLPDGKTIMWKDGDMWLRECPSGSANSHFDGDWLNEDIKVRVAGMKAVLLASGICLEFKPAGLSCSLLAHGEEHWGDCSPDGKMIFWEDGECWHRQEKKLTPAAEEARQQYLKKVKGLYKKREGAALHIQTVGRRLLARKELGRKRKQRAADEREMRLFKNDMAIKLQAAWRQKQAHKEVQKRRAHHQKEMDRHKEMDRRKAEAATKIEAAEKGRQARKTHRSKQEKQALKADKQLEDDERKRGEGAKEQEEKKKKNRAASQIQRGFLGFRGRAKKKEKQREKEAQKEREEQERREREAQAEREEQERREKQAQEEREEQERQERQAKQEQEERERKMHVKQEQKKRDRAASKIQHGFRGHAKEQEKKREIEEKKRREEWDKRRQEKEAKRRQEEREREMLAEQKRRQWEEQEQRKKKVAASKIQHEFRGYRKSVTERQEREMKEREQEERRQQRSFDQLQRRRARAAKIIQSKCRSYVNSVEFQAITAISRRELEKQKAKERKLQLLQEERDARVRAVMERRRYDPVGARRDEAATQVQANWRGAHGRQEAKQKQRKKALQKEKQAYQRKLEEMSRHPKPKTKLEKERDKAAAKIQARYRGGAARNEMKLYEAERRREEFYSEVTAINLEMDSMVRRLQVSFLDPKDLEVDKQTLAEMSRRLAKQATSYKDTVSALAEAPPTRTAFVGQGSARRQASPTAIAPGSHHFHYDAPDMQLPAQEAVAGQLPPPATHAPARAVSRPTAAGQVPRAGVDDVVAALRSQSQAYTPPAGVQNRSQRQFGTLAAAGSCETTLWRDKPSPGQGYMSGVGVKMRVSQDVAARLKHANTVGAGSAYPGDTSASYPAKASAGISSKGVTPSVLQPPSHRRVQFSDLSSD